MSATQHTTNLHLSQFQATDIPTWMSDYNGDMMRIDNSIGNISDLVNPEGSLVDNINAFQDDVDALETLIGSATDLPVPTDTVAKNISQINNNLSKLSFDRLYGGTSKVDSITLSDSISKYDMILVVGLTNVDYFTQLIPTAILDTTRAISIYGKSGTFESLMSMKKRTEMIFDITYSSSSVNWVIKPFGVYGIKCAV